MLADASKISKLKISSIQAGPSSTRCSGELLIDAATIKVVALGLGNYHYILLQDILSLTPYKNIIITNLDQIFEANGDGEMPRIDKLVSSRFSPVGMAVFERRGNIDKHVGRVSNIYFDIELGFIVKLDIISTWQKCLALLVGSGSVQPRLLDRNQILEIYPNRIIVSAQVNSLSKKDLKSRIQGLSPANLTPQAGLDSKLKQEL